MDKDEHRYGYFSVTLRSRTLAPMFHTNTERAFVLTQLQDALSPRMIIQGIPEYRQLAACIDLLCFLVSSSAVHLIVFGIDQTLVSDFSNRLMQQIIAFQAEYTPFPTQQSRAIEIKLRRLAGPHQALSETIRIHQLSPDWEYDRYSSIGFYLHDRRGDWMRIWRLTKLYQNNPDTYRSMLTHPLSKPRESIHR
jgi:hypothetical protein